MRLQWLLAQRFIIAAIIRRVVVVIGAVEVGFIVHQDNVGKLVTAVIYPFALIIPNRERTSTKCLYFLIGSKFTLRFNHL